MECDYNKKEISVCKTIFENFMEDKCECDISVPDYYPGVEKIIHCKADSFVMEKEIENDRLIISGVCRFSILYMGEDGEEIRSISEETRFSDSFSIKNHTAQAWVQTIVRTSGVSCRVMNSKRISAKATVSVAIKVKTNKSYEVFDKVNCNHIETLRESHDTYAVYDHLEEHVKVQGEILAHTDVHSVLGTDGSVCVKDVKVLPGKAVIKGILNLYVLFSAAEDPKKIENTSTAIPFTQVIELSSENGEGVRVDVIAAVQSIKTDVEADPEGRNRLISVSATVQTEGELFNIERSDILVDAYSNLYPLEQEQVELALEELTESSAAEEVLQFNLELDSLEYQPLQILAKPYVQKVCGKENELIIEGALDVSAFLSNGEKYRNFEKTFSFTMRKRLSHIGEGMRCEINPCIISTEWMTNTNDGSLKVELQCSIRIYEKKIHRAISGIIVDEEHPLECTGRSSLIIYFGEKGERIWDIARRYHTSSKRIKEINNVSVETLSEKQLLLIS